MLWLFDLTDVRCEMDEKNARVRTSKRNFIIALEWGKALNCIDSRFTNRYQDGGSKGAFYFNTGYTF